MEPQLLCKASRCRGARQDLGLPRGPREHALALSPTQRAPRTCPCSELHSGRPTFSPSIQGDVSPTPQHPPIKYEPQGFGVWRIGDSGPPPSDLFRRFPVGGG